MSTTSDTATTAPVCLPSRPVSHDHIGAGAVLFDRSDELSGLVAAWTRGPS
jgi:hypothetical protein